MRFEGIQGLRFIAAALVVATHSTLYAHDRLDSSSQIWNGGTIGVDFFFVISGFVMIVSSAKIVGLLGDWKEFLGRRVVRIVPMYWVATSIKVAFLIAAPTAVLHSDLSWVRVVASYLFLPTRNPDGIAEPLLGVGWTLIFEMFFYVLFAAALAAKRSVFAVCVPVLAALALANIFRPDDWPLWTYLFNPIVMYFAVGMFLGRYIYDRNLRAAAVGVCGCLALQTVVGVANGDYLMDAGGVLRAFVAAAVVIAAIVLPGRLGWKTPRGTVALGDASYSMYLFHPIFAPAIPAVLFKLGLISPVLSVVLTLIAMPVMSLVIYRLAELPTTNRMRRWAPRARREHAVPVAEPA